ncbi:MAG: hypothetical protein Kow0031_41780 [Anaerolineae bacterium]
MPDTQTRKPQRRLKIACRYQQCDGANKIVQRVLAGFDAPILQAMVLDKPMRDHTLPQAICRTNRTYGDKKSHGLIVDYPGVFDDVATALEFDERVANHPRRRAGGA